MHRPSTTSTRTSTSTAASSDKPADYVYFERSSAGFSDDAIPRAKAAQLKLEHFYKVAVDAAIERNSRYVLVTANVNKSLIATRKAHRVGEKASGGRHDVG